MPGDDADVARLLALDPDVPGLRLLLDDRALSRWLADRAYPGASGARRTYLRWKPGAGGVARVRVDGADLFLAVWHRGSAAKLDKTVVRGGAAVELADPGTLAVLAGPGADRHLPGLGRLLTAPGRTLRRVEPADPQGGRRVHRAAGAARPLSTLAWKPQRRWVGLAGSPSRGRVVLRAYRPSAVPAVVERYRAVGRVLGPCAPALLGQDGRRGLVAVEHLPGRGLHELDGPQATVPARAAGALLAGLHTGSVPPARAPGAPGGLGVLGVDAEVRAVEAAARAVDLLVPGAGAAALARDLVPALRGLPWSTPVLLHGDLSVDQLVVGPGGGVGLIDLDEVVLGPASFDLAGLVASWWLQQPAGTESSTAALLDGYATGRDVPGAAELRVRTAAHLLRRAPEPFRSGRPGWAGLVAGTVDAAARTLADGVVR